MEEMLVRLEDFRVRREVVHEVSPSRSMAVAEEMRRLVMEGPPEAPVESEVHEAVERWLDPEPVPRSLVRNALWEMERHYWDESRCSCGEVLDSTAPFAQMRSHREDVLAAMLGLTIRPGSDG